MTRRSRRALGLALWLSLLPVSATPAQAPGLLSADQRQQDFDAFCRFVGDAYAYFDLKTTDWTRTCTDLAAEARAADDTAAFVGVLERALAQLYDHHAHLATHTPRSARLVPSQADVMATWRGGKAIVTALRQGSAAAASGLRVGDEIEAVNGVPVTRATAEFEPVFVRSRDPAARDWALRVTLAGRHDRRETVLALVSTSGLRTVAYLPSVLRHDQALGVALNGRIAHLRVNNSLGDPSLIGEFDSALARLPDAEALVIDLRDTPSGGTSQVARGILGRLVDKEMPYQRHELVEEFRTAGIRRIWVEHVAPRGPVFRGPVVVLVGRWTGSMGEGLAIGLDAARGAPVLGTPMAHLLGALGELALPNSGIVVRIPVEKLSHVDGRPRESFVPCPVEAAREGAAGVDDELSAAFALADKLVRAGPDDPSRTPTSGCR